MAATYAVNPSVWPHLTAMPLKAELYERETYFREGLADADEILGADRDEAIWKVALLLIKPDGLLTGKISAVVGYLEQHGFSIVAVEQPILSGFHWRELWRYQLNCATLDRLAVNELVLPGQSLLLMLRHEGNLELPASVWLSAQKGPSDISAQDPGCLRRLLAQSSRILSFIHVADEPADVIRELAILLEPPARRRVWLAFRQGEISAIDRGGVSRVVAASDCEPRVLDACKSLERIQQALFLSGELERKSEEARQIASDLERMRKNERIVWRQFIRALAGLGLSIDRWDLATLGSHFIVYEQPGIAKQIKSVDSKLWAPKPARDN